MILGRNAPCHCGSGRKYKRCCLAKDEAGPSPEGGQRGADVRTADSRHSFDGAAPRVAFWAVAYLDILGYRQILKEMSSRILELKEGEKIDGPRIAAAAERSIKIRRELIGIMQTYKRAAESIPARQVPGVPPEIQAMRAQWSALRVRMAHFSDSIMLYMSLGEKREHDIAMPHLHTMLVGCCGAQLLQLARGADDVRDTLPLRGAMDVDMGVEYPDRLDGAVEPTGEEKNHPELMQFYSAALARAYEVEQTEAVYPRVVVTEQFLKMLDTHANDESRLDLKGTVNRQYAEKSGGLLTQDGDGFWFVDFMGPGFRELSKDERQRQPAEEAWKYVKAAYELHRSARNHALARKYLWLRDYMRPRLSLWGVQE